MGGPGGASGKGNNLFLRLMETDLDRKDGAIKVFQFAFPWAFWVLSAIVTVSLLALWRDWGTARNLLDVWIFYTLPPAGKETLIPLVVADKYHPVPGIVAGLATFIIDLCFSLFLIWNYDWVKRMPVMGPALERTEAKGREKVESSRWFRRATFFMTTFFVFVPLSGSGGVGGTILGRVVGMRPYRVFLAVLIGSFLGSLGYGLAAERLSEVLGSDNPVITFISNLNVLQIVAVILVIGFVIYTVRNPRMAAIRTTRVISAALDMSEKALIIAERERQRAAKAALSGARATMMGIGRVERKVTDVNLQIATKPMEIMGKGGKKLAEDARRAGRARVESMSRTAGTAIERTVELGERAASRPMKLATELTIEGVQQTRAGVERAGSALEKGTERLEGFIQRKRAKGR